MEATCADVIRICIITFNYVPLNYRFKYLFETILTPSGWLICARREKLQGLRGRAIFEKCAASDSSDLSEFGPGDPERVTRGSKYVEPINSANEFAHLERNEFKDVRLLSVEFR